MPPERRDSADEHCSGDQGMDGFHDIAPLRLSPVLGMIGDFRKQLAIGGLFLAYSCFRAMVVPERKNQLKQLDR